MSIIEMVCSFIGFAFAVMFTVAFETVLIKIVIEAIMDHITIKNEDRTVLDYINNL